jgi:NAD(P)-dependent dehydrogenase (short-subunit alcohol dehydrogenase family)
MADIGRGRREPELAACVQGDVSNRRDFDRLFAQIEQEKGKLDIVFATAGIAKYFSPTGGLPWAVG